MAVRFVDPRGASAEPVATYDHQLDMSEPLTVALLANGFPDSEEFLDVVGEVLAEQQPNVALARFNKRNASAAVSAEMLASIVDECDAVIAAYGH